MHLNVGVHENVVTLKALCRQENAVLPSHGVLPEVGSRCLARHTRAAGMGPAE